MQYYSHVLHFPNSPPFDNNDFRWTSFVGEFVRPIVEDFSDLYWFSYYTTHARFRIYTDKYNEIQPELESLRDSLGLIDKGEEKDLTLEQDLGSPRFVGPNSNSTPFNRALLILKSLRATCDLFIDSIFKRNDGYWDFEENKEVEQNPTKTHLFSVNHLYHNITASPVLIATYKEENSEQIKALSYYYFTNAVNSGKLDPLEVKSHQLLY